MAELRITRAEQLVPAIYAGGRDRRAIAGLARLVTQAAEEADDIAARIVERAAGELARMVLAVARRLGMMEQPTPLALAGGVLGASVRLADQLESRLREAGLVPQPIQFVSEPALGALKIARSASNEPKTPRQS